MSKFSKSVFSIMFSLFCVVGILLTSLQTQNIVAFTAQRKVLSQFEAYLYSTPKIEVGRTVVVRAVISDLT